MPDMEFDKDLAKYPQDAQDGVVLDEAGKAQKAGLRKDAELYRYVLRAFETSREYLEKRGYYDDLKKNQEMYDNEPWKALGVWRPRSKSKAKVSLAWDAIETSLPVVTARPPKPDITAKITAENQEIVALFEQKQQLEQGGASKVEVAAIDAEIKTARDNAREFADKLEKDLVERWAGQDMQKIIRMGYRENGKFGNFVLKSVWNHQEQRSEESICSMSTIYPSPICYSIEDHVTKRQPFIYAPVKSIEEVREQYGLDVIDERALGEWDGIGTFKLYETGHKRGTFASIGNAIKAFLSQKSEGGSQQGRSNGHVLLIECWMPADKNIQEKYQDYEYDDDGAKVIDDDGNPQMTEKTRPRFPEGWKVVTIIKGHEDWVIAEEPNRYKGGRPPFFMTVNYQQANDFLGTSEIHHIEDLLMRVNRAASDFSDNMKMFGSPRLVRVLGTTEVDESYEEGPAPAIGHPITDDPEQIIETTVPNGVYYLNPPSMGPVSQWYIDGFLMRFIDRILHMHDAFRGFNANATDSGRKIRELREAATGFFQPKLDEQTDFCKDLFEHWAHMLINFSADVIVQNNPHGNNDVDLDIFNPAEGQQYELAVNVSAESILPADPWQEWEELTAMYSLQDPYGNPLVPPEVMVDAAPTVRQKLEIKDYLKRKEEEANIKAAEAKAFEQFQALAEVVAEGGDEETFNQLLQLLQAFPNFITTNEWLALPLEIRKAILVIIGRLDVAAPEEMLAEPQPQTQMQPQGDLPGGNLPM